MLDGRSGRVACRVLESGSILGLGGKLFDIPFEVFAVNENNHPLILNVDKETLNKVEGFDKNNWPDFGSQEWAQRTHDYYGYISYFNRRNEDFEY